MMNDDERETWQQAKPCIRSIAAFALYLRFGQTVFGGKVITGTECYVVADQFLAELEKDLNA